MTGLARWRHHVLVRIALAGALMAALGSGRATAITVSPILIEISAEAPVATVRVEGAKLASLWEVDVVEWRQVDGVDTMAPTSELVVTPPIFALPVGGQQLIRVGMVEPLPPAATERAYRLQLREVTPFDPSRSGNVRVRLHVNLPVFMAPVVPRTEPVEIGVMSAMDGRQMARVRNGGSVHLKFIDLQVTPTDGEGRVVPLYGYVLAGASRLLPLPASNPADQLRLRLAIGNEGIVQRTIGRKNAAR